jgi:carotenoid cleavage dioxygenase
MTTGRSATFDCEGVVGEVVFAPRQGGADELDGYYLAFVTSLGTDRAARFVIWDAAEFPLAPRAEVVLPQRVPNGLHGNWFSAV